MNKSKKYIHKFTFIIIVIFMILLSACTDGNQITYKQISMDEAVSLMEKEKDYIILDVRTPEEFSNGHIPNAINIPNETIKSNEINELPNKNQLIFVYCRSGNRSKQAANKLTQLGYNNIIECGGIIDWPGEIE